MNADKEQNTVENRARDIQAVNADQQKLYNDEENFDDSVACKVEADEAHSQKLHMHQSRR